jgi:hypothetical protein
MKHLLCELRRNLPKLAIALLCTLLVLSCSSPKQANVGVINLEEALNNFEAVKLSEISESIRYIPLETTSESLIKEIQRGIAYDGEYIYIKSLRDKEIKIFDKNGKYVKTIDRSGRGPGEYNMQGSYVALSPVNGNILVLGGFETMEYDFDGNFIKKIDLPQMEGQMLMGTYIISDNRHIAAIAGQYDREYSAVIYDSLLNIQKMIPVPDLYGLDGVRSPRASVPTTFGYDNSMRIFYPETKEILTTTGNDLDTAFVIDYGKYRLPGGMVGNDTPDDNYISLRGFMETENYLLMTANTRNVLSSDSLRAVDLLYDKRSMSSKFLYDKKEKRRGFQDDIMGGPIFWPANVYGKNIMYSYINPIALLAHAEKGGLSKDLQNIVSTLKEDSNPVIVVVELKK